MILEDLKKHFVNEHGFNDEDWSYSSWEIIECHEVMSKRIKELEDHFRHNTELAYDMKRKIKELEAIIEALNFKMSSDAMMADNRIKELEGKVEK